VQFKRRALGGGNGSGPSFAFTSHTPGIKMFDRTLRKGVECTASEAFG